MARDRLGPAGPRPARPRPSTTTRNTALEIATRLFYLGASRSPTGTRARVGRRLRRDGRLPAAAGRRRRQRRPHRRHAAHDGDPGGLRAPRDPLRHAGAGQQRLRGRAHRGSHGHGHGADDGAMPVSWTAVAGATSYDVYRSDGVAAATSARSIVARHDRPDLPRHGPAERPDLLRTASSPWASNTACFGPDERLRARRRPWPGRTCAITGGTRASSGGDGDAFLDNCELGTITFAVNNTGIGDLTNVRIVDVTPVTHPLDARSSRRCRRRSPRRWPTCDDRRRAASSSSRTGLTFDGESDFLVEVTADELNGDTRAQIVKLFHTRERPRASCRPRRTASRRTSRAGRRSRGTFNRVTAPGANGTNAHMSRPRRTSTTRATSMRFAADPPDGHLDAVPVDAVRHRAAVRRAL